MKVTRVIDEVEKLLERLGVKVVKLHRFSPAHFLNERVAVDASVLAVRRNMFAIV
jgi:hypothetical protein